MNQREGDEAGAVFGYVETGEVFGFVKTREVRPLRGGDWYAFNGGVLPAMNEHVDGDAYPIVRPLILGRDVVVDAADVVVDAKMVERLREFETNYDEFINSPTTAFRLVMNVVRAILAAAPPAAPADPLKSTEFIELLDAYATAKGTEVIGVVGKIRDYLRKNAAGIAAAAKEAT